MSANGQAENRPDERENDPWAHLKNGAWASFYAHAVGWVVVLACVPYAVGWFAYATVCETFKGVVRRADSEGAKPLA
jgi:hypothetical protein